MTLDQWAAVGEFAATFITFVGILLSLYMSVRALREVQIDRKLSKAPHLAFEPGGQRLPLQFDRKLEEEKSGSDRVSGEIVRIRLKTDEDRITYEYGKLRNFGLGPAIETHVIWVPQEVWLGKESFRVDELKLSEPKYSRDLNTIPSSPSHILPGQEAQFYRIPAFIMKDTDRRITRVDGLVEIRCKDIMKDEHTVSQEFHVFTGYDDERPYIHFAFGDLVEY